MNATLGQLIMLMIKIRTKVKCGKSDSVMHKTLEEIIYYVMLTNNSFFIHSFFIHFYCHMLASGKGTEKFFFFSF